MLSLPPFVWSFVIISAVVVGYILGRWRQEVVFRRSLLSAMKDKRPIQIGAQLVSIRRWL